MVSWLRFKNTDGPLIMAGDLNTTGADNTPTSIRREIMQRVKSYEFWATQALKWVTPASLPLLVLSPVKYFKNYLDPTSAHVPIFASNKEARLFRHIERFRFVDHNAFDFRGSTRGPSREGEDVGEQQSAGKQGFEPTFVMRGISEGSWADISWTGSS